MVASLKERWSACALYIDDSASIPLLNVQFIIMAPSNLDLPDTVESRFVRMNLLLLRSEFSSRHRLRFVSVKSRPARLTTAKTAAKVTVRRKFLFIG